MENKKFVSVIWWYHRQIFSFKKEQNYHMMPLEIMKNSGYICEVFAINSHIKIEDDPNFVSWTRVIYYKNIFQYLIYLCKNRRNIIYSNSLTIKTLLVWIIGRRTVFYPHDNIFWRIDGDRFKKTIIHFFYKFFTIVRVNNTQEFQEIEVIKKWLGEICPLVISPDFLSNELQNRSWVVFLWNIIDVKNPYFLLDTCEVLQSMWVKIKIKLVGEDRINFKNTVTQRWLQDYFEFCGFVSHEALKSHLITAKILINTSKWEWQCIAVYEWALAWCLLCLPRIRSFPSVFKNNALYHSTPKELAKNIIFYHEDSIKNDTMIKENQSMILKSYSYTIISLKIKRLFAWV